MGDVDDRIGTYGLILSGDDGFLGYVIVDIEATDLNRNGVWGGGVPEDLGRIIFRTAVEMNCVPPRTKHQGGVEYQPIRLLDPVESKWKNRLLGERETEEFVGTLQ
jgi:hypothetical protein